MAEALRAAGRDRSDSAGPGDAAPGRRLRRAARRAGPGLVDLDQPVARRHRHLAARPVAARLRRRGQPRRHHPAGRPARRHARPGRRRAGRPDGRGRHGCVATVGKSTSSPAGSTRSRPRPPPGWTPAAPTRRRCGATVAEVTGGRQRLDGDRSARSPGPRRTPFDTDLLDRLRRVLPDAPLLGTGAGHDAGILATAGIPTGDALRPQPDRVSHSPAEHAERDDCLAGVEALADVLPSLGRGDRRVTTLLGAGTPGCRTGVADRVRLDRAGRPVHRGRSRTSDPQPATRGCAGVALPGFANAPQPRLPPRAARAHARRGGTFWTWRRADVRRRRPARPGQLPRAGPRRLRRDGAGRVHRRRRVPLPAPRSRRAAATPTRTRWARPWSQAAAEAGIRLTLLDTCYLRGGLDRRRPPAARRGAAPVRRRHGRRLGRAGRRLRGAARELATVRVGAAVHSVRAVPARRPGPAVPSCVAGRTAARAPLRAAGRERGRARRSTAARPTALLHRARAARPDAPPPCTPPT